MLQHLIEYAKKQGLVTEPGFAPKVVRWAIEFSARGEPRDIFDLASESNSRGRTFPCCPDLSQPEMKRGGTGCRHFLVDNAEVVVELGAEGDPKVAAKHAYFLSLLRQAKEAMPVLGAIAERLADPEKRAALRARLEKHKARPTDNVTFVISSMEPEFLVEADDWHDWWRDFRQQFQKPQAKKSASMLCLATGKPIIPAATHPKVRGLSAVGGLPTGDTLISFKQESFRSYGLMQSANAPMSTEAASQYSEALSHLIAHGHSLASKVRVAYWYKEPVPEENDPLLRLIDPSAVHDEKDALTWAKELLAAIETGKEPKYVRDNHFYVFMLSGASGRVMVRDFIDGPFESLLRSVEGWFDALSIVHREGGRPAPSPNLWAVLGATARTLDDVAAPTIRTTWRCALEPDLPIPDHLMTQALLRARVDAITNQPFNHARMGLLKAFHYRADKRIGGKNMRRDLNPEHPSKAYQCGRLLAVLSALQYRALGNVGAGVVQRYYASASATPALAFGSLIRNSNHHLAKLEVGIRIWYEKRIAEVMDKIADEFPTTLDLREQSLFALGYYQQQSFDRSSKPKKTDLADQEQTDDISSKEN